MVTMRTDMDGGERFAALRGALGAGPLLGFDTATWMEGAVPQAKPAFVGISTYSVKNTDDSGAGSLRAGIESANANGAALFITFDPVALGGPSTITLKSTLTITSGVIIDGDFDKDGVPDVTISGNNSVGVFTVDSGKASPVELRNLNITGGRSIGTSGPNGSGADQPGQAGGNAAGGVYVKSGTVRLDNDTFSNNTATGGNGGSGGFAVNNPPASPTSPNSPPPLTPLTVTNKGAGGTGGSAAGAVYVEPIATVQASKLTFVDNTASGGAGGTGPAGRVAGGTADPISNSETVRSAAVVCFVTGTRILTLRGEVAVEDLRVGDRAATASGAHRPIRWIGRRTSDCRSHPAPRDILPVRISAGAFGENRPARDLVVSPGHAICLDVLGEVLIPASVLVNGTTITQQDVDSVTYWHVELDSHDILVAEGQPAESYLDVGNRAFFAESGVVDLDAAPDATAAARTHADFCRPYVADGVVLDAVRAQVRTRAERRGWRLDDAPWAGMHLMVDGVRVEAETDGLAADFVLPASAQDVWLVSETSAPRDIGLNADPRRLGLCLRALTIGDGDGATRSVALDDPRLSLGFHHCEGVQRWTAGRTRLPADLFAGCRGTVTLRLDLARPALPRWIAPTSVAVEPQLDRAAA